MDKLPLVFAVLEHFAKAAHEDDVLEYLQHTSQHSDEFNQAVKLHRGRLVDLGAFKTAHAEATQIGGSARTYTKSQLDAMVQESVQRALAAAQEGHEQTFTRSELDAAIAKSVAAAMKEWQAKNKGGD